MDEYPAEIEIVDSQLAQRPVAENDGFMAFRAYRETREISLRDQIVCKHLHLVHSVARRFSGLGESLDDLIQEGSIGLLNAVDQFDPDRGVKFSTYASHLVTSQIQHYLRDRGRLIRQPAWVQELNTKIARATEQLFQELGRDPSPNEVAQRLNLTEDAVQHVLSARELNRVVSLTTPADGQGDNEQSLLEKDVTAASKIDANNLSVEDRIVLEEAISSLKTLEQKAVRLFYFGDLNQSEIARKLGISVNYSSYLLRRSLSKIKAILDQQRQQENAAMENDTVQTAHPPVDVPTYDQEVGVYTGAYLRARATEEIIRSQRYPTNFALMLAQVQGVAEDNAGMLLPAIGQMFRNGTRTVDLVAYLGDNRFALLLPHTGREARILGERLCAHPAQSSALSTSATGSSPITLNIGFAVFPMDGTTVKMLFDRAERALEAAINIGPNVAANVPAAGFRPTPAKAPTPNQQPIGASK